jgi:hypothetical protein
MPWTTLKEFSSCRNIQRHLNSIHTSYSVLVLNFYSLVFNKLCQLHFNVRIHYKKSCASTLSYLIHKIEGKKLWFVPTPLTFLLE